MGTGGTKLVELKANFTTASQSNIQASSRRFSPRCDSVADGTANTERRPSCTHLKQLPARVGWRVSRSTLADLPSPRNRGLCPVNFRLVIREAPGSRSSDEDGMKPTWALEGSQGQVARAGRLSLLRQNGHQLFFASTHTFRQLD